jgi:hypothetical protein
MRRRGGGGWREINEGGEKNGEIRKKVMSQKSAIVEKKRRNIESI